MSILGTAMCAIGRHTGAWSLPGSRCESVRTCTHCGAREERSRHTWGPYAYTSAGACDQTRRCERCGGTEPREMHDWGPWFYHDNEFNSAQLHACRRCHATERTRPTAR